MTTDATKLGNLIPKVKHVMQDEDKEHLKYYKMLERGSEKESIEPWLLTTFQCLHQYHYGDVTENPVDPSLNIASYLNNLKYLIDKYTAVSDTAIEKDIILRTVDIAARLAAVSDPGYATTIAGNIVELVKGRFHICPGFDAMFLRTRKRRTEVLDKIDRIIEDLKKTSLDKVAYARLTSDLHGLQMDAINTTEFGALDWLVRRAETIHTSANDDSAKNESQNEVEMFEEELSRTDKSEEVTICLPNVGKGDYNYAKSVISEYLRDPRLSKEAIMRFRCFEAQLAYTDDIGNCLSKAAEFYHDSVNNRSFEDRTLKALSDIADIARRWYRDVFSK